MAPKNNERFARIVSEAFSALGVTQVEFTRLGGPSDTTLRKIMDGQPVGISARTLNGLDRAFKWTPGSAARTLAGGDPTPLSDEAGEFVSKLRHPSRAGRVVVDLDRGGDLVTVLTEILSSGELPPNAQEQLERLRDEAAIEEFPKIFEELSHNGKLRVAKFGQNVRLEELKKLSAERELEFMELPAHSEPDVPYRTPSVGQIHFSPTGEHHELTVAKRSLFTHYAEMYRRASRDARLNVMRQQAENALGGNLDPDIVVDPEIDDAAYVQYLAARLSAAQDGDPDLHAAVSLSDEQYEAARARYQREMAEMTVFDGQLRTLDAPPVALYAEQLPELAARSAPPGYRKGEGLAGRAADDDENQVSETSPPTSKKSLRGLTAKGALRT